MRPKLFEKETRQSRKDTLLYVSTLGNDEWAGHQLQAEKILDELRSRRFDAHSMACDPGFVDAANRDFRLRPDAPARKLGIRSIPQEKIGLQGSYAVKHQ